MTEKKRFYICDRLECYEKYGGECHDTECRHTSDRHHAANCPLFNPFLEMVDGSLWESPDGWRKQAKSEITGE